MVDSVYAMAASIRYNTTAVASYARTRRSGALAPDHDESSNQWESAFTLDLPESVGRAIRKLVDQTLEALPPNIDRKRPSGGNYPPPADVRYPLDTGQSRLELYA
ncbi:MAG: hypothetical protein HQL60_03160 [Magnetococcales bacterium]|nr:hypothetical protein [Magnetococcales bacterium]